MHIDKTIKVLALICSLLTLTLLAGFFLQGLSRGEDARILIATGFDKSRTARIGIKNDKEEYTLSKVDSEWTVANSTMELAARPGSVDEFLNWLEKARTTRTVSADGAGADTLGFSSSSLQVRLYDTKGSELGILTLGNRAQSGNEVYARWGENPGIFALESSIALSLARSALDWADKRLWPSNNEAEVSSFAVLNPDTGESFVRASDKLAWSGSGSPLAEKATATEITPLLRQVLTLEGTGLELYAKDALVEFLAAKKKVFSLRLNNGQALSVDLYQAPDSPQGDYYALCSWPRTSKDGKQVLLVIPTWRIGDLKVQ